MSHEQLLARIADLEARLAAVEDVQAIERLKSRYGRLADSRYGPHGVVARESLERIAGELAALFHEDAVWDGGPGLGVCRGREAIRQRFLEPTLSFSWHYFVKPHIEVQGDHARGTWDILAPCTSRDGRALWMSGFEEDEYVRQDGVWLHASMKLSSVFLAPHDRGWAKRPPAPADQSEPPDSPDPEPASAAEPSVPAALPPDPASDWSASST